MAFHTNLRRAFPDYRRAVDISRNYARQTGWKFRVRRVRSVWRVEKTDRRVPRPRGEPKAVYLGEFRGSVGRDDAGALTMVFTRDTT